MLDRGAAGAAEQLNDIVSPLEGVERRVGGNTAVDVFPGIEMGMPTSKKVKIIAIQDIPQLRPGSIMLAVRFVGIVEHIVIGHMNEKKFMGGLGLGQLGLEPG